MKLITDLGRITISGLLIFFAIDNIIDRNIVWAAVNLILGVANLALVVNDL